MSKFLRSDKFPPGYYQKNFYRFFFAVKRFYTGNFTLDNFPLRGKSLKIASIKEHEPIRNSKTSFEEIGISSPKELT